MDSTCSFFEARRRRAIRLAGLAGLALAGVLAACGNVVIDRDGGGITGGTGGTGGGGGSATRGAGQGGVGGTGGAGCALTTTGTGAGIEELTECFPPPSGGCPNTYDAPLYIMLHDCMYLVVVECGPVVQGGQCCYVAKEQAHPCNM